MSMILAVCGKGGAGKTTLTAMFCRLLLGEKRTRTLIIDADPTGGLTLALGLPVKSTIDDLRREVTAAAAGKGASRADLAAAADYRLLESLTEYGNLALLAVGRPEEEGCYCQVNSFLRQSIEYLSRKFDLTIIDAEAGIEQVNRRVIGAVDRLLLVSDLSQKGLRVAETIHRVNSASAGAGQAGLVLNRVCSAEEAARATTTLPLLGCLPEDETVLDFDRSGKSFLNLPDCPALAAAAMLLETTLCIKLSSYAKGQSP